MRIGSLFSGYGGLSLAVEQVFGGTVAWHCENEAAPSKILEARWPGVPNLGDITRADWATVEPVDVIEGGSPCQDVSHAGRRAGMKAGTRSGLWASMREAIAVIRPRFVVFENVRGVLSAEADSAMEPCPGCVGDGDDGPVLRALGRVLGDLAELGYDAQWRGLRAADVGTPHGRFRIFVVATDAERGGRDGRAPEQGRRTVGGATATRPSAVAATDAAHVGHEGRRPAWDGRPGPADSRFIAADADGAGSQGREPAAGRHLSARGATADTERGELQRRGGPDTVGGAKAGAEGTRCERQRDGHSAGYRGAVTADADRDGLESVGRVDTIGCDVDGRGGSYTAWGVYEPAIRRWERLTRPAPAPTERAPKGGQRLSPRFVEWMQGLPAGWVTDVPGVTRNDQLKALGNGVVPQQATSALADMLETTEAVA